MNKKIQEAIECCGSKMALAKACGISRAAVVKWLNGGGIRAKYIQRIVNATNGQITADELLSELNKSDL